MRTKILNYLFFTFVLFYFAFLFSRVLIQRLPQNPLFLISFFLIFAFSLKIFPLLITLLIKYKELFFKKKQKGFLNKILFKIKDYNDIFEKFLKVNFLRNFLGRSAKFSIFFFACVKFYETLIFRKKLFLLNFWILTFFPWILSIIVFLLEITINHNIYYTLYFLALNFCISRIISFWFSIVENTCQLMSNIVLSTYLGEFFSDEDALQFFVNNPSIRIFLVSCPELRTKRMLKFCWTIFDEAFYFIKIGKVLEIFQLELLFLKRSLSNIRIILYSMVFCLYFYSEFWLTIDFFIILIIFFSSFAILVVCLNFLDEKIFREQEFISYQRYLDSLGTSSVFCHDNFIIFDRNVLLVNYPFLVEEDLPSYKNTKNPKEWYYLKNTMVLKGYNPDYLLTEEEKVVWEKNVKILYLWYIAKRDAGFIDKENFSFSKEYYNN